MPSRARIASALVAVVAAAGLAIIGPVGSANAANTIDQITGNGATNSALTVSWSQGLLNANNTTFTPRDLSSATAFLSEGFQNLKVTVSQTQDLVHQSINVTWTGGTQTTSPAAGGASQQDFLQMMQCYGDSAPTPESCQFGSSGLLTGAGGTIAPANIGSRAGNLCAPGSVASQAHPPKTADGSVPGVGCDALEKANSDHVTPCSTTLCPTPVSYSIPFEPVTDPTMKIYGPATDFYDRFNTNEVQFAPSDPNGSGQQFFQTL